MARRLDGALRRITASEASIAVKQGHVTPLFQPIEALQTGECRGFEALARIRHDGRLYPPAAFLDGLDADDRLCLFGTMLGASIALFRSAPAPLRDLYVSINVEVSLLVSADFVDILLYFLERYDFSGERLVLELLESEEVTDFSRLQDNLEAIRRLGLSIALDDIGTAYASLTKIRDLPIDIFKLDRSFSRDLEMHPEDLTFVLSILSLAAGLGKRLVVEGIETPEAYDALRVLGVDLGQGYGIAPPMPADAVEAWLAARAPRPANQAPLSLLGAYASLLTVVESCRCLRRQPLPIAWTDAVKDHENCVIGRLFGARGWRDTEFGAAHAAFHGVLPLYATDESRWRAGADRFRDAMAAAIAEQPKAFRCDPVEPLPHRITRLPPAKAAGSVATIAGPRKRRSA